MASSGGEDLRRWTVQPPVAVQAKTAVLHVSSFHIEKKRSHPLSLGDSKSLADVKVCNQPYRVSGVSSKHASPTVPRVATTVPRIVRAEGTGASPSKSGIGGLRTASIASKRSPHFCNPLTVCHLEPIFHNTLSRWPANPLRLKPGLLGKRAFAQSLAVYQSCPSLPKTSSQSSPLIKRTMPTNQSCSWSRDKLRSNSNRVVPASTAKVPTNAKYERSDLDKPNSILSAFVDNADLNKLSQTAVLLEDVPHGHDFRDQAQPQYIPTLIEDTKENKQMVECDKQHSTNEAPQGATEVSSEVEFTAAVEKLAKCMGHICKGTLNGFSGPVAANFDSQKVVKTTEAKSLTETSVLGIGESCKDTDNSHTLCVGNDALGDGLIQDNECAISEDIRASMDSPQSPTVYLVMNQISAIHLTKEASLHSSEEDPSLCLVTLDNRADPEVKGQENGAEVLDDEEEELADELENACSDRIDDGSSESDSFSAVSLVASLNIKEPPRPDLEDDQDVKPALVPSLFPFMPPTLYFGTASERVKQLPEEQRKLLKWKMSSVTPNIVKNTVVRSHFTVTKKNHDWLGCWGHHMKSPGFKAIREYQKLNHFPGSFQIGRKDRLWRNLSKMQARFGKQEFAFFPRSFVLPQDTKLLKKAWEDVGSRQKWIIKPPASARGIGIQVIHKWSQMPRKRPLLVQKNMKAAENTALTLPIEQVVVAAAGDEFPQPAAETSPVRYIHKPYLISGSKFDLRIYVYVTSYDPLRVYIFNDGLVRFASCKYSSSMKSLGNKFMHLTNYSVNKKNSEYQTNSDDQACQGHKWALKALWRFLGSQGINTLLIWDKIKDMVIKTIIASDPYVNSLVKMHVRSPYSCHELFGFDIMLDENLKPWVLEVNISPSLHSNSTLDVSIKGQMIRDVLNLAGFVLPKKEELVPSDSYTSSSLFEGMRVRSRWDLSPDAKLKRAFYLTQRLGDQDTFSTVLEVLTPEDVHFLAESEDELNRQGEFERIFPSPASSRYLRFFDHPRYLNILLNQWEQRYHQNRSKGIELLRSLCQKRVHLGNFEEWAPRCSSRNRFKSELCGARWSKTQLSNPSVPASPSVTPQPDHKEDNDWSDHDEQSLTSSTPDLHLFNPESLPPKDCL